MSTTTKDGGPAFPCFKGENCYSESGMSLRDWFAGQALAGVITAGDISHDGVAIAKTCGELAMCAYKLADAMLEARENKA